MPNFKKTRGFTLRSGNKPSMSSFKMMGSSPANMRSFGIGEGTSPSPLDKKLSYDDALKNDPDLEKHIAERKKHKAGSTEYEAAQAKINTAYGTVRDQDLKAAQIKNAGEEETKEETEVSTDDDATNIKDGSAYNMPKVNKAATAGKKALGAAFQGLTHGLDAVYGTGKVNVDDSLVFTEPKKKKDDKTGEEKVDEIINKE
jgi:hypothetical protein